MKIMFIGAIGTGKTTLIQTLENDSITYDKTQVIEYRNDYIDTPGEYMQHRMFWCSLTTVANDADIICFLHDSSSDDFWFSPGLSSKFEKPVIGIVTKTDCECSNIAQAERYLRLTGCRDIYYVSAFTGEGVKELKEAFSYQILSYHMENSYRYANSYFD